MSKERPPRPTPPPAVLFRQWISDALASGGTAADMTLHLTLGDGHRLRRDTNVPLDAISYSGGEMRFLGVKVVEGGVNASALERPGEA